MKSAKAQRLLKIIGEFVEASKSVAEEFYMRYDRKDLLRAWHDGIIPQRGKLNSIVINYSFHGKGLYAKLKDKEVDFDFGPNDRNNGFDAWRLRSFLESQEKYRGLFTLNELEELLLELHENNIIEKPEIDFDSNYYLK